jgi:hypothetical protein
MRKTLCILFVAALSISVRAQDSRVNVSVGYALVHTDFGSGSRNLNGFEIDYLVKPSFRRQWFSVDVKFARYFGSGSIPLRGVCDVPGCITNQAFERGDIQFPLRRASPGAWRSSHRLRSSWSGVRQFSRKELASVGWE